jgi:hypothetical protein
MHKVKKKRFKDPMHKVKKKRFKDPMLLNLVLYMYFGMWDVVCMLHSGVCAWLHFLFEMTKFKYDG